MRNIVSKIDSFLSLMGLPALLGMVLLTTVDVFLRYVFLHPIPGSVELVEVLMIVAIALTLAQTLRERGHVSVTILLDTLPEKPRCFLDILNNGLTIALWSIVCWQSFVQFRSSPELSAVLNIPVAPFYGIIAIGSAAMCLTALLDLFDSVVDLLSRKVRVVDFAAALIMVGLVVTAIIWWLHPNYWGGTPFLVGLIGALWLVVFLFIGLPVAFGMAIVGFLGMSALRNIDVALYVSGVVPYRTLADYGFSVIACFVLMGEYVYHAEISREIYQFARAWVGRLPGGLAISTVTGCALFASISGDSLSTTLTMGTISLPEMKKHQYRSTLSAGSIASGGTLGVLIPPSIVFILYGLLTEQSIGRLFIAGILPGILLAFLYSLTIYVWCMIDPEAGPPGPRVPIVEKVRAIKGIWTVVVLFVLVIGGIYSGLFTPNEAGAVGAVGALLIGVMQGRLKWKRIMEASKEGARISTMAFTILIGAGFLGYFFAASKVPLLLAQYVSGLPLPPVWILLIILIFYTFLGMLMPAIPMVVITVPLFFPLMMSLGYDPIWYGVITVIMFELAVITPPVGINIYGLSGIAPDLPMGVIFRGVLPFVAAAWVCLIIMIIFPSIATFLPNLLFGL